ncbi:unnamed protein product [Lepidochelys kempii]
MGNVFLADFSAISILFFLKRVNYLSLLPVFSDSLSCGQAESTSCDQTVHHRLPRLVAHAVGCGRENRRQGEPAYITTLDAYGDKPLTHHPLRSCDYTVGQLISVPP